MANHGKILRFAAKPSKNLSVLNETHRPLDAFFTLCQKHIPSKILSTSCTILKEKRIEFRDTYKKIIGKIILQPFLAAFALWAEEVAVSHPDTLDAAKTLLEHGYVCITDKNGSVWTIEHAQKFNHHAIIDAIRCNRDLQPQKQERLVTTYVSFMQWLSTETHGYIKNFEDTDLTKVKGRMLTYPQFIHFISVLKEKERIVAKLLYFGGDHTLEDVLNIELDDIDFKKLQIRYPSEIVDYPRHIFSDIQMLISKKPQGKLFLGRQNAPLNASTVFRNFKKAAIKTGLGSSFFPSLLASGK